MYTKYKIDRTAATESLERIASKIQNWPTESNL